MQPDRDEQPASTTDRAHLLDYTNLANLGPEALIAFLSRLGENRTIVPLLGGRIATVLLTHGYSQRTLETLTGIPQQTLSRWIRPLQAGAAR